MEYLKRLIYFAIEEAKCCVFPVSIFIILAISKLINIPLLYRYDFILIACIIVQISMVVTKLETVDELKVICLFHIIGLFLELYKVRMGSWSYPEKALVKFGGVPLYSGFMYASVASYVCQAWKRLALRFLNWPNKIIVYILISVIYLNFFSHHFFYDIRWIIIFSLFIIFRSSKVEFKIKDKVYKMYLIVAFFLIGFFIWIAENIATFFGAWMYPEQINTWHIVSVGKISSWFLLVIISISLVVNLKSLKYKL